jgi:hypothetical protein
MLISPTIKFIISKVRQPIFFFITNFYFQVSPILKYFVSSGQSLLNVAPK